MEGKKTPISVALISKRIQIRENEFLLIPMFAVKGSYNKNNKYFTAVDGKKYISARTRKGAATADDLVCDFFAVLDSEVSLSAFNGETLDEKITDFFNKNKATFAYITVDKDGYIRYDEMFSINNDDADDCYSTYAPQEYTHSSKKRKSVPAELDEMLRTANELNNRFQDNAIKEVYTINDLLKIIDKASDVVDVVGCLQDCAILYRDAYQTGAEGVLLKGETDEERKARREKYYAAAENVEEAVIEKVPDYFNPKQAYDKITRTVVGQDQAAKTLIREIHRKISDPKQRNLGILLTGHTGSGKTLLIQTLAKALSKPIIRVDTPQITVAGYTGTDIEEVLYRAYKEYGIGIEDGIIYFEEIDKKGSDKHSDVSGKGVLDLLLSFLDGTTYQACNNMSHPSDVVPIHTDRMIKIAGGAFSDIDDCKGKTIGFGNDSEETSENITTKDFVSIGKMSGEFIGRFPTHIRLKTLNIADLERILRDSDDSMLKKQVDVFSTYGVKLIPTDGYIHRIAEQAAKKDTGGRGLSGKVLDSTGVAYDDITWNMGKIESITLTEATADNPHIYQKIYKKEENK